MRADSGEFLPRSVQKFSVKPFSKGLWGAGQSPALERSNHSARSAKIKIQHKQPPRAFFGSIPKNAGDKFFQSKFYGKTWLKPRVQSRLTNLRFSLTMGRDCTRAIFRVRCPKNRPRLSQSRLNGKCQAGSTVKLSKRAGEATLPKPVVLSSFGRGFTRAISAVRCRRNRPGFAETQVRSQYST